MAFFRPRQKTQGKSKKPSTRYKVSAKLIKLIPENQMRDNSTGMAYV